MSEPTQIPTAGGLTPAALPFPASGPPAAKPAYRELGDDEPFPDDLLFPGEPLRPLSDRDRDRVLDLIENPPEPNEALRRAMARWRKPDA